MYILALDISFMSYVDCFFFFFLFSFIFYSHSSDFTSLPFSLEYTAQYHWVESASACMLSGFVVYQVCSHFCVFYLTMSSWKRRVFEDTIMRA